MAIWTVTDKQGTDHKIEADICSMADHRVLYLQDKHYKVKAIFNEWEYVVEDSEG